MQHFFNSSSKSVPVFKEVIRFMSEYQVNPTPINYAVVYQYCMDKMNATSANKVKNGFTNAMESLLTENKKMDDASGLKLYRDYLKCVPESPAEVLDKMRDFPSLLNDMLAKAHNYAAYHLALKNQDSESRCANIEKLQLHLTELLSNIQEIQLMHDRVNYQTHAGGLAALQDVFTELYTEQEAVYAFGRYPKEEQLFFLMFAFEGMDGLKQSFGEQIEEAVARHFARLVGSILPEPLRLYRLISDDAYLIISCQAQALEAIAIQVSDAFKARDLIHKSTQEKINAQLTLKKCVIPSTKQFKQSIKIAKQSLRA